jgi:outer membrane protein OmpA-like peptidoglycan-associated protein
MTHPRILALLAIVISTATAPAVAATWDADSARILDDPSFLPVAGQVEGQLGYTYSANLYDAQTRNASRFFFGPGPFPFNESYDRSDNSFGAFLSYGITNDISLFASMDAGNSRNREAYSYEDVFFHFPSPLGPPNFITRYVRGTQNFRTIGATNPEFGATWRVIDQARAPVSVDLTGSYRPDIFQARSAGLGQTGSVAGGGQSGTAQLAVSREMNILTLRAYGSIGYLGRENDRGAGGYADLRNAPHATYAAGLQTELRLVPWFAINAGVNAHKAVRFDRVEIFPSGPGAFTTIEPGATISPYVGAVIPLVDNHLVTELLYQHDFIGHVSEHNSFQSEEFFHQSSNLFTARLIFAFGGAAPPMPPYGDIVFPPPPLPASPNRTYLVFFDWDRADLTPRARQIVAQAAAQAGPTRIQVSGYTDLSGTPAYNQRLSLRRATTVAAELVQDGVPRTQIAIAGRGEANPLIPTAPGVREPQNRRVEIILVP